MKTLYVGNSRIAHDLFKGTRAEWYRFISRTSRYAEYCQELQKETFNQVKPIGKRTWINNLLDANLVLWDGKEICLNIVDSRFYAKGDK